MKSGASYEEDLIVPSSALSPSDGEFQEAGKKEEKKKLTKETKSKQNISHLLSQKTLEKSVEPIIKAQSTWWSNKLNKKKRKTKNKVQVCIIS